MPVYLPPRAKRGSGTRVDPKLDRVRKIATVLDRYLVDPIVGLVLPGAGDIVGSLFGLYTISLALQRRAAPVVIARMLVNLAADAALGVVPIVGDLFDVGFRANQKNVALLAERTAHGGSANARDWAVVAGAALLFLGAIALSVFAIVSILRAVF